MKRTFWNGNHPMQNEYDVAFEYLVSDFGVSPTLGGEVLRLSSRICYDAHNNGMCNGGENSKYMEALDFIKEHIGVKSDISNMIRRCRFDGEQDSLNKMIENALNFAKSDEGKVPFIKPYSHPLS